jgi:hypothetical protein
MKPRTRERVFGASVLCRQPLPGDGLSAVMPSSLRLEPIDNFVGSKFQPSEATNQADRILPQVLTRNLMDRFARHGSNATRNASRPPWVQAAWLARAKRSANGSNPLGLKA